MSEEKKALIETVKKMAAVMEAAKRLKKKEGVVPKKGEEKSS